MSDDYKNLMKILTRRYSCRSYSTKEIEPEKISQCLEAARVAPSACNKQPWRFRVVTDPKIREMLCNDGLLPGLPMPWLHDAPAIVVVCAETNIITHTIAPLLSKVKYQLIDIGIAGEHFILAAEALGLGSCWVGWFKPKAVRKILKIPRNLQILSLISIGYPTERNSPPEKNSIDDIIF